MRTIGRGFRSLSFALALTAVVAVPAAAQRHVRRARQASTMGDAPTARAIPARCNGDACAEDYELAVVAALFPFDDGLTHGPAVLTLVIENRGTTRAPLAMLDVAPLMRNVAAHHSAVAALEPGERTVVEVPIEMGPGGAPCIAITVGPSLMPTPTQSLFYASTAIIGPVAAQ
jgi:hypothetical protein